MKISNLSNQVRLTSQHPKVNFGCANTKSMIDGIIPQTIQDYPLESQIIAGLLSIALLVVTVINRKTIGRFVKNLFKSKHTVPTKVTEDVEELKKIQLPKPNFTVGEEKAEQFAKEKAEYINRIRAEYIDIRPEQNKEKSIVGLKALQKYGTREDMLSLDKNFYDVSKDNEIMHEYAKLVGEVGETIDYTKLYAKLDEERYPSYTEKTHEEIMKALKKLMVDKSEGYDFTHYNYGSYKYLEKFAENYENNSIIKEAAESIMRKIEEFNPSYKD